jgi:prephenate dehydrogenase (NADP+)
MGAIVSGQTSVKAPEKIAFEKHLPLDTYIISCHSLHGPKVDTVGQPLVLIQHRAPDESMAFVEKIFSSFRSRYVYLSYEDHDVVTANTQAVTHAAFLTMGTAWMSSQAYPWESGLYPGGIETVKINIMLRIYSAKWHVYAGLAILNPSARTQVTQYADSTADLFKLMVAGDEQAMLERVMTARREVFGWADDEEGTGGARTRGERGSEGARERKPILLSDKLLDQFHLVARKAKKAMEGSEKDIPTPPPPPPNSHLALLAIVDCWHRLQIDPYAHLDLAATPIFRIWIGVCEYLFQSLARVIGSVRAAIHDNEFRSDDTEFTIAARGWAQAVQFGSFDLYRWRFEQTADFFASRFEEANKVGAEMLKAVAAVEQT